MPFHAARRWTSYTEPFEPLLYAAWSLRVTIIASFRAQGLNALSRASRWRDEAFALWYKTLNKHFVRFEARTAVPSLVSSASGVVVDLGPALGNQIPSFDRDKVSHVYGIEKNPFFLDELQTKVEESELRDKYTIVTCGIEDTDVLEKHGITDGSVDTILCIQVLCSVSDPDAVARGLYKLLVPGGRFVFWEHHRNHDFITRTFQWIWNPLWRFGIGDCSMTRDMLRIVKQAGKWENTESIDGDEQPWSMLPRTWGQLVKSNEG